MFIINACGFLALQDMLLQNCAKGDATNSGQWGLDITIFKLQCVSKMDRACNPPQHRPCILSVSTVHARRCSDSFVTEFILWLSVQHPWWRIGDCSSITKTSRKLNWGHWWRHISSLGDSGGHTWCDVTIFAMDSALNIFVIFWHLLLDHCIVFSHNQSSCRQTSVTTSSWYVLNCCFIANGSCTWWCPTQSMEQSCKTPRDLLAWRTRDSPT